MTGWRLLLTRPAEDCAALAERLAGQGIFSSCLPLLDIVALPVSDKIRQAIARLPRCNAVIVVSKPAARIGVSCRICERTDCTQRAFPPLDRALHVPENERGVVPYVLDGPRPDRY